MEEAENVSVDERFGWFDSSLAMYSRFKDCQDEFIRSKLEKAMNIISDSLRLFGPRQLCCSYNGGKDAAVILHLLLACFANYAAANSLNCRPNVIYFKAKDEFPEIEEHIHDTENLFNLKIYKYDCGIMEGLCDHLQKYGSGYAVAFILGTRRSDPDGAGQQEYSPSSSWMKGPAFLRVNPILDWEYGHVWHFLRSFGLPYCRLYDEGYSSLGHRFNSHPNRHLKYMDCPTLASTHSTERYWPAYLLTKWETERDGRFSSSVGRPAETDSSVGIACCTEIRLICCLSDAQLRDRCAKLAEMCPLTGFQAQTYPSDLRKSVLLISAPNASELECSMLVVLRSFPSLTIIRAQSDSLL